MNTKRKPETNATGLVYVAFTAAVVALWVFICWTLGAGR